MGKYIYLVLTKASSLYLTSYWIGLKSTQVCHNILQKTQLNLLVNTIGLSSKESACNGGDMGSIPELGRSPGKEEATHSCILASEIPWTEQPGRLYSMESQRVRHNLATKTTIFLRHLANKSFTQIGLPDSSLHRLVPISPIVLL